ncbi:hypothetical protein HCBG_02470 [Histoplasma capsulatum G186AR]|uniref:Uncharacterized protein n=1 Tax=Ajellomyces capsulatus (strain G186AR / H82 / ATCC MYA-2454 / RMSCC 2432) TaxID=447093 RepID=C0NGJ8_AJECG|nr:uncharacterized protein HCBG_02470 [Histoplasma capsulatum G186AR]EEH08933.1 hypothetical protein HCBG_02470 [Histoplasma capsulatum G186AR]
MFPLILAAASHCYDVGLRMVLEYDWFTARDLSSSVGNALNDAGLTNPMAPDLER